MNVPDAKELVKTLLRFTDHRKECGKDKCDCGYFGALGAAKAFLENGPDTVTLDLSSLHYPQAAAPALEALISHVEAAEEKFPWWPRDIIHAAGIVGEEAGELERAALQQTYEPWLASTRATAKEAYHTAATALRFLVHIPRMRAATDPEKLEPPREAINA